MMITPEYISKDTSIYELRTFSNFYTLTEEKQKQLIVRFLAFINNATIFQPLYLILYKDSILYNNRVYPIVRVFIASKDNNINYVLMNSEYKYKQIDINELPFLSKIRTIKEYATYIKATDNYSNDYYIKAYTLASLASTLYPAWIYSLLQYTPLIVLKVSRVEHATALSSIMRLAGSLKATYSIKLKDKALRAEALREALLKQETALMKCIMNCYVIEDDKHKMIEASKAFKRNMRATLCKFTSIPFKQCMMLLQHEGKELFIELGTLAVMYPFISSDMLELDGILLGENVITKAPCIYDYRNRDNYNVVILATSGAGKSVTAKLMLTRLLNKYEDAYCYVVDPQGEYENLASVMDASLLRLTRYEELGLDPFLLLEDKTEIADIIAEITNATDVVKKELRVKATQCSSIFELYEKVSTDAKIYLQDLVLSDLAVLFKQGDISSSTTTSVSKRNILSLKGTYGEERTAMLLVLAIAKAWKTINQLPKHVPKILVVDEGWLLFTMQSTARFMNLIARTGRKLNVIFIFITQRPEDVIANEYGRALLDNSDTKLLLRNNELATIKIAEAMQLSREEKDMLVNFVKGECLLITREHRLRVQIKPTDEELEMFSTTPITTPAV
jgi:hypothetical protein